MVSDNLHKAIFKGALDFGNKNSMEKVLKMFVWRLENFHKNDLFLKEEELFDLENSRIYLPRVIVTGQLKTWKHTISMLEYLSEFAIAGKIQAWLIKDRELLHSEVITPTSDRVAVTLYNKGLKILEKSGKQKEGIETMSNVITKFATHSMAYAQRGIAYSQLGEFDMAFKDLTRSIELHDFNPESYFERANVHLVNGELSKAIGDLEKTVKRSIPHEEIYWEARYNLGSSYFEIGEEEKAIKEFKLLMTRTFDESHVMSKLIRSAHFKTAKAHYELEQYEETLEHCETALKLPEQNDKITQGDIYLLMGMAKAKLNQDSALKDLKKAKKLGSKEADEQIREFQLG